MKRLLALLLPLCLLLAGCSRNTQALQEEVDRLAQALGTATQVLLPAGR